jgi:RHS repeat-associated protein
LSITYSYTGSAQTFTVPSTVSYEFNAYGAQGGGDSIGGAGGFGAFASGTGTVTAGNNIQIYVGGVGSTNASGGGGGGANGGANGGSGQTGTSGATGGGAGGSSGDGGGGAVATNKPGGGGGGGFFTAGGNSTGTSFVDTGGGIFSGLVGGTTADPAGASGGYGGGGAGDQGGGGGGGYSGGGGGSFIFSGLTNQQLTAGNNEGNGLVQIDIPVATLVFNNGASNNDMTGSIAGAGAITIAGTGTVIFEGSNSYLGGTTISSGTLQIGNNTPNGTLPGNVTDSSTLSFSQSTTYTYGGVISGTGSVVYADDNTTVLTGSSTYSGGTNVNGNLELGNGGTTGSINGNVNILTGNLGISGSGLDLRLYALQDANYNVVALVNTSGTVVERFDYSPYGTVTVLSASGVQTTDQYAWQIGFQGGWTDPITGLINFQQRHYDPTTGTWTTEDPAGYMNGMNLYQFVGSNPATMIDPLGLCCTPHTDITLPTDGLPDVALTTTNTLSPSQIDELLDTGAALPWVIRGISAGGGY